MPKRKIFMFSGSKFHLVKFFSELSTALKKFFQKQLSLFITKHEFVRQFEGLIECLLDFVAKTTQNLQQVV